MENLIGTNDIAVLFVLIERNLVQDIETKDFFLQR